MDEKKVAEVERPDVVDDEYLTYLDTLRDSGVTNMLGAGVYLQREFGLSRKDAKTVLMYWIATF